MPASTCTVLFSSSGNGSYHQSTVVCQTMLPLYYTFLPNVQCLTYSRYLMKLVSWLVSSKNAFVGFIFHIPRCEFGGKSHLKAPNMVGKRQSFVLTRITLLKETLEDQMKIWKQKSMDPISPSYLHNKRQLSGIWKCQVLWNGQEGWWQETKHRLDENSGSENCC